MKSVYTGMYVQKNSEEKIHTVQAYDTARNSMPLNIEVYIERNIKPNVNSLPSQDDYKNGKRIK